MCCNLFSQMAIIHFYYHMSAFVVFYLEICFLTTQDKLLKASSTHARYHEANLNDALRRFHEDDFSDTRQHIVTINISRTLIDRKLLHISNNKGKFIRMKKIFFLLESISNFFYPSLRQKESEIKT